MKKSAIFILVLFLGANAIAKDSVKSEIDLDKVKNIVVESLNLNNVKMSEAARLIALATSTPIVVSNSARNVMVDIHLKNVTAKMALDAVCRASGLWYQRNEKDGLIHILTVEEFKNSLQFNRTERVEVVQILYPAAKDVGEALAKLFINRAVWIDPSDSSGDAYSAVSKALKRMDLIGDRGTFDIVDSSSSSSDDDDDDDDDEDYDSYKKDADEAFSQNTSNIKNENLNSLFGAKKTDKDDKLSFFEHANQPGMVFISVLPENNTLMLRSADAGAVEEMLEVIKKLDLPSPQVLLEVKILSVALNDTKERAVDLLFADSTGSYSGGFADGTISSGGGNEILKSSSYDSSTGSGLVSQGSGITSQAAIFSAVTENFKARIQILETDERITALATPNLIVSNNESSSIFIGTETTVMEKAESTTNYYETTSGGYQPSTSWTIDAPRRTVGTSLLLTPKIHADRTVTLRLLQECSTLGSTVDVVYSGGVTSTETTDQYFTSQNIDLQRVVTTVVGKDREFMVIGGLISEEVGKQTERIPGLSDIPIIGELLFTRMYSTRNRYETIIIIRPFVMLAPGETQLVSQSYLERMSQHPAATNDLPSLGVNSPAELAKPRVDDPNDPWLQRMFNKIQGWEVDDSSDFDIKGQKNRETRRQNHQEALKEIERLQNEEK